MNKFKLTVVCLLFTAFSSTYAQKEDFNPLQHSVPSLTIAPDARGGAMGYIGTATEPDVFSQYWNPAKYVFASSKAGVSMSYTPWLAKLVDDIDLVYAAGYYKFGGYDNLAIGASIRYFSLGSIVLNDSENRNLGDASPYEMAADISISMRASETFSLAVAGRYIRSDLGAGLDQEIQAGNTVAADIAGFYSKYLNIGRGEYLLGLGFNISNIGPKISYDDGNNFSFLPTTLRLGASFQMPLDDYNTLAINTDISKYLVPTPPIDPVTGTMTDEEREKYKETSSIAGMFTSFSDAPGGMSEELKEVMWALGAEYAYDKKFFIRTGYFHESKSKGNRQYYTVGGGFKLSAFQMDIAYLISSVPSNPLDQTLRFSLSFDLDGMKGLMR